MGWIGTGLLWLVLLGLSVLTNKYVPYCCMGFCVAYRMASEELEESEGEAERKKKEEEEEEEAAAEAAAKSQAKRRAPPPPPPERPRGLSRKSMQRRLVAVSAAEPTTPSSPSTWSSIRGRIDRASTWVDVRLDTLHWYLDKFIVIALACQKSFDFALCCYNDTLRSNVRFCHTAQHMTCMITPVIAAIAALSILRNILSEARKSELWMYCIVGVVTVLATESHLRASHFAYFTQCTADMMKKHYPATLWPFDNFLFRNVFDKNVDLLGRS